MENFWGLEQCRSFLSPGQICGSFSFPGPGSTSHRAQLCPLPRDAQSESIETGLDQSRSTQAVSSRGRLTPSVFLLGINVFLLQTLNLESGVLHSGV